MGTFMATAASLVSTGGNTTVSGDVDVATDGAIALWRLWTNVVTHGGNLWEGSTECTVYMGILANGTMGGVLEKELSNILAVCA